MVDGMKAQMIFEFIIAIVIFFTIVFYIINVLNVNIESFSSRSRHDVLQTKALEISELLVSNKGIWNGSIPIVLGLVKNRSVLDSKKIIDFNTTCNMDYNKLKGMLGLKERVYEDLEKGYEIRVTIYKNQSKIVECGPFKPPKDKAYIKRFALSENGDLLTIVVEIW